MAGKGSTARTRGGAEVVTDEHLTSVHLNCVQLIGRVSAAAEERELPSGDVVVTWRLVVPRSHGGVDTIDCAAWTAAQRRRALRLVEGEVVQVEGALRRRFWRSSGGAASRYEVEVTAVSRAGQRARAS